MKAVSIYVTGAIVIGILEIIDGVLLIMNHGLINDFNLRNTKIKGVLKKNHASSLRVTVRLKSLIKP